MQLIYVKIVLFMTPFMVYRMPLNITFATAQILFRIFFDSLYTAEFFFKLHYLNARVYY